MAVQAYGPFPTAYERGVLQGLECALLLLPNARSAAARDNTQPHETDGNSTN